MAMMPSFPPVGDLGQAGLPMVQAPNFGGDSQFPVGAPIQVQQQLTPAIPGEQLQQQQQYQQPQFAPQPQQFAAPQPQFAAPQQFAPQPQAAFVPQPQQFEQPQQFAAPAAHTEFNGNLVPPPMPTMVAPALPGAPAQVEAPSDAKKPNAKTLIAAIKKGEHDHELHTLVDDRASVQEAIANRKAALTGGAPVAAAPSFDNQSYAAPAAGANAELLVYVPVPVSKLPQVLGLL